MSSPVTLGSEHLEVSPSAEVSVTVTAEEPESVVSLTLSDQQVTTYSTEVVPVEELGIIVLPQ